jgi:hypothetical protein
MSVLLAAVLTAASATASVSAVREPAALGLAVNVPDSAPERERRKALEEVRAAGVSMFSLELSWPDAESRPRRYDVDAVTRSARMLRQSGAVLHLDLPLVNGRVRRVPSDLDSAAFDDPRLSIRLGRLLDALGPALADFSTLSLGNEADSYFADKPGELRAFVRLIRGAVEFLRKRSPRLLVGVATAAPMDSRFPAVAAAIHEKCPALFYVYSPFLRDAPFRHRPPAVIDREWASILSGAAGRPVGFTEVSYSSAPENGSSPERQAEFVRRMKNLVERTGRSQLLFARYVPWRDPAPPPPSAGAAPSDPVSARRAAFFANRGLQRSDGKPKPAWKELAKRPAEPVPRGPSR